MARTHRFVSDIPSSEITPESVYLSRRRFMQGATALAATGLFLGACGGAGEQETPAPTDLDQAAGPNGTGKPVPKTGGITLGGPDAPPKAVAGADELGDPLNDFEAITTYNNFYEFSTDKEGVAPLAEGYPSAPWAVQVGGLTAKPRTFGVEDFLKRFPQEERVYRLRCVEGWSMVIPWVGFPLVKLLEAVEPTGQARFVRFETILDPERMPGQNSRSYTWPYVEGLRLDEAMNDLAILATGLYGKQLLPQNGAPLRLVVPWKYGFKSIKSIVKIDLVADMPTSLWMDAAPREYGFYANVNPDVPHPRWSQSSERRIGEFRRRRTLPFNGYAEQVASLYAGMDLEKNY